MDICLGPGGLCIFIQICLHSWMRNKFLYCTIVCDKSHTLFSSSPASYSISLEKQGNLSRKICHEVKITPGKRLKLAHLLITLMRVTLPSLLWWKKWEQMMGRAMIACDEQVHTAPLFTHLRWCAKSGKPNSPIEGFCVCFFCAQWTWLWL